MVTTEVQRSDRRDPTLERIIIMVGLLALCWIVGNPRSAGPDEPSHMVTSAAIVRGDFEGRIEPTSPAIEVFEVPNMVGAPDPGCWALQPDVPVACANAERFSSTTDIRATTSANYAPWAFVLPGLASFAPWAGPYAYLARMLNALVPVAFVAAGLFALVRDRAATASAALLGATPIVWFTVGTVNPSALAITGGFALWAGLLATRTKLSTLLALAGWGAVLLARRDGPLWASAIVIVCCAVLVVRPRDLWNELGRWRWVAVALTPLPLLPALQRGDLGFNLLLAVTTVSIPIVDLAVVWWMAHPARASRSAFVGYTMLGLVGSGIGMLLLRPGGFRAETLRLVAANTGTHLQQLVGVLGWLDAPVPTTGVYLFWAAIGGLVAVALLESSRAAVVYAAAIAFAIVIAWILELGQGANYGQYWQGRYTMPFVIGLPIVLAWRPPAGATALIDRLALHVAGAAWIVINIGFFAAQRRWGVGIDGSWYPWDWDTWGAPVPPVALTVAHTAVSGALALTLGRGHVRPAAAQA